MVAALTWIAVVTTATPADSAAERYRRLRVEFSNGEPQMGVGTPLSGETFYQYVERDDLVRSYRANVRLRDRVITSGSNAISAGFTPLMIGSLRYFCREGGSGFSCHGALDWVFYGSLIVVGTGALTMIVASWINPDPISPIEARQIADDWNAGLMEKLELMVGKTDDRGALLELQVAF